VERYFKYLFNGPFNGPWAGAIHSFLVIPPISRYPTHLPITIKRGFRQTSGQRVFKYLFGEDGATVRRGDSRGQQYPKKTSARVSPEKKPVHGSPPKNNTWVSKNILCKTNNIICKVLKKGLINYMLLKV